MMDNAILVSLSRQVALQRQIDVIANNVANMNTAGFRSSQMLFEEHMMPVAEASTLRRRDRDISFVLDRGTLHDFSQGPMVQSDSPLDVAIDGEGWFVVETPEGERYTRNGGFQLAESGHLVTSEGYRVLGDAGPIVFDERDSTIAFAADGTVSTEAGDKGRLRVVTFAEDVQLQAEGTTLFSAPEEPADAEGVRIVQGMIEKSNVNAIVEMARMIEVNRAYASHSTALERADRLRRDSIATLGRIE